ncbi:U6 snRNA binding, variant 3 [Bonamia ostreae]|uniref:U6 snRNA binding, variant 3 n=1 Tax=Bonamia ostreae TaxID=126728 RepID=A0ABV2AIP4_9EUKA
MGDDKIDFPILCETCLGDNPFLRMTRTDFGQSCKICDRPFTIYRWRPGVKARFKKTQICRTCAQLKNVCQTCVLDLQFGLPVQVRDKAMAETAKIDIPVNVPNRDFQFENLESKMEAGGAAAALGLPEGSNPYSKASAFLSSLSRKRPYYTRNLPHLCSFFQKGECKRGSDCPYRHERDEYPEELRNQNIKNRFYGVDDPVAKKLLRARRGDDNERSDIEPPTDKNITTIFVGGVDGSTEENDLSKMLKKYGEITKIALKPDKGCGFVTFGNREDAEEAIEKLNGQLIIGDTKYKINWSKTTNNQNIEPTYNCF